MSKAGSAIDRQGETRWWEGCVKILRTRGLAENRPGRLEDSRILVTDSDLARSRVLRVADFSRAARHVMRIELGPLMYTSDNITWFGVLKRKELKFLCVRLDTLSQCLLVVKRHRRVPA